jgi:Gpi18-like mannosyltransferase
MRELLLRAWWPWVFLLLLALALRLALWPNRTVDYYLYLQPWVDQLRAHGNLAGIGQPISNYTPPYLYLLAVASYLPVLPLIVVKALGLLIDAGLAVSVGVLVATLHPGARMALAAATGALLVPSVALDSALLGQCDALYVMPLVVALTLILRDRPAWGCVMVGVALAVKLQAIFILPFLVVLVVGRRLPVKALPWAAAGWAGAMAPAVAAGRPITELPGLYADQVGHFTSTTLNAPNLYQWVPDPPLGTSGAVLLSALAVGGIVLWLVRARIAGHDALVVRAAVLILLVVPFTLPRMHERYTLAAEVLAIVYACVVRRGWLVALAGSTISALAYLPFGVGLWMPLAILAGCELALILVVARELVAELGRREVVEKREEETSAVT